VRSLYRPYDYEPFRVDRRLGGGKSVTFESGSGANHNKLTGSFIYNNDVGEEEGARVVSGSGARFVDRCG
jgi:vacuolar-type H+-ATPase subunit B/Vma2